MLWITFINATDVAETSITLSPWLNVISTPAILRWISFSNSGDNISFATLQNHKRQPITINNNNVWSVFTPLTWFIVRNDTSEDVTITLSYGTNIDESGIFLEKKLDDWRNLLWITTKSNPFENIANATATTILDLTDWTKSNKVITWRTFQLATWFTLWKAYWVFINQLSWLYWWRNNYKDLNGLSPEECQEICENDDYNCPNECRIWILSDNAINNTTLHLNDDLEETVYSGTFTANKFLLIDSIYLYWNDTIPEWDELMFYVYINDNEVSERSFFDDFNDIRAYRMNWSISINTWESISFRITARYAWTTENIDYNYEFKPLWDILFYETNPQTISFSITWEKIQPPQCSTDFINAYNWADNLGILEDQAIDCFNLNDEISNIDAASLINNYAKNILNHEIDSTKDCTFIESEWLTESQMEIILESCQLWLIEENDNIDYTNPSNIATLSPLISRILWNDRYDWWNPYYVSHLNALTTAWILTNNDPEYNELKWDILVTLMNTEWKNEYWRVDNSYSFLMNDFNAVEDIYTGTRVLSGDRVIYIVRHSARENNCGEDWWLTQTGMDLASWVWDKLKWEPFTDTSTDFYWSSYTKRTVQTSYYVGKGRGNANLNNNILLSWDERRNYEYVNHDNSSNWIVKFVYWNYFSDGTRYSDIEHLYEENTEVTNERALNAINKLCDITDWHPFSWIASHDRYTLPITERATNENITFNPSTHDRPNFMQWVAIIVHEYGGWEIYPVRSLDTGKMDWRKNPGCS